jgi:hypothetical protein
VAQHDFDPYGNYPFAVEASLGIPWQGMGTRNDRASITSGETATRRCRRERAEVARPFS